MFRLVPLEQRLCDLGKYNDFIAKGCRKEDENLSYLDYYMPSTELPSYWILSILGLLGTTHRIYQLAVIFFSKKENPPTLWHNHEFYILPVISVRRLHLVMALIETNAWALFLYASLFGSPLYMYPWLLLQVFKLVVKAGAVTLNSIVGTLDFPGIWTTSNVIFWALTTWYVHRTIKEFTANRQLDIPKF